MAYGIKYRFRLESTHGVLYTVNLLQNGYSGSVTTRPLGKAPVIRMQDNAPFRSTSCSLTLECQVDTSGVGEFAQLYTSDPREYQVQVFRGGTIGAGGTLIWIGFVVVELYSEPDIAPPYNVEITATDGLGVLKEYYYPERGRQTLREQLRYLLQQTGMDRSLYVVTSEQPNSGSPITLLDSYSINLDYMVGESCYDVLTELLNTLHMTVTQYRGNWLLMRESDVSSKINSSGTLSVYSVPSRGSSSSTSSTTITNVMKTVGKMGVADLWPVGYLTRRVSPAKKQVTIEAPWHMNNVLQNPNMASDTAWNTGGMTWNSNGYYQTTGESLCYFTQAVEVHACYGMRMRLKIRASMHGTQQTYNLVAFSYFQFQATGSSTIYYYHNQLKKWQTSQPQNYDSFELGTINDDPTLADEFTMDVPALPFNNDTTGTFTFYVAARNANIFFCSMEQILNAGYRDNINLDNGARGKSDTVTIAGGRTDMDIVPEGTFLQGVFVDKDLPYNIGWLWRDARWQGLDFMSITALDYALSVALPRIELSGTLDFPSGLTYIPFVLSLRNTKFVIQSYDYDLLEEEIRFTALSVPAATLTVDSETITSLGD